MWRMIIGFLRNHGQELIYIRDQYCKSVNFLFSEIFINQVSIFPPGTIHVLYTEEDSVFCGGNFLTPRIMSQFLRVLGQIEVDPSRTNDEKNVDFFQFLENFIGETLKTSKPELTKRKLNKFVVTLEKIHGVVIAGAT